MVKRRLDNPYQRRAKRETNDHRNTERESNLHDGPAQVLQMLEKRLGRFSLRRITKFKNVSQRHRTENSMRRERQKAASGERGANAKRVGVADFVLRNHATNLFASESAAIENRFAFIPVRALCAGLNWTGQKEITALIGKPR